MVLNDVEIIDYTKRADFYNCLTHAVGAVLSAAALVLMLLKGSYPRAIISGIIYGLSLIAVYTVSAVYHGLKGGERKRKARLIDHCVVPVLIAGTATPCAMITLYRISAFHCALVMCLAWGCAFFGIISKLFFFNKLKAVTMAVYIISCIIMLLSVIPVMGKIDSSAFMKLIYGCAFYLVGAVFCALGKKKEACHIVFHVFVLLGSAFHFYVIYTSVL